MKNDCNQFQELLALQAMGDLSAEEVVELDQHLASCAQCRESQAKLLRTVELLGSPPDFQLTELESARMEAGFYKRLNQIESQRDSRKWNSGFLRIAAVLALIALGFAGGKLMPGDSGEVRRPLTEYPVDRDRIAEVTQLKEVPAERSGFRLTPEGLRLIARGRNGAKP